MFNEHRNGRGGSSQGSVTNYFRAVALKAFVLTMSSKQRPQSTEQGWEALAPFYLQREADVVGGEALHLRPCASLQQERDGAVVAPGAFHPACGAEGQDGARLCRSWKDRLCQGPRRDASKYTAEASAPSLCLPLTSCLKDANAPQSSCSCCQAHLFSLFLICFAAEAVEQVQSLQHSFPDIYRCFHREGGLQERPPGNPR